MRPLQDAFFYSWIISAGEKRRIFMKEKFESLIRDLERYSKEDSRSAGIPRISDHLKGYYEGTSQAYALCAKWLKGCLEGRA
jgi:hypothetical protein